MNKAFLMINLYNQLQKSLVSDFGKDVLIILIVYKHIKMLILHKNLKVKLD